MAKEKKATESKPSKGGAPTKYRLEYCQQIIDFCVTGKFISQFAQTIGVHTDTLLEWKKVHPEFSVAYKRARESSLNGMLDIGRAAMLGKIPKFIPSLWIFQMKAIHGLSDFGPQELDDEMGLAFNGESLK